MTLPRPVVRFSDGSTFVLNSGCVIGREPRPTDRTGLAAVAKSEPTLSRAHAEVRLSDPGVAVVDLYSHNGTFAFDHESGHWTQLTPHEPLILHDGQFVAFARLVAWFETGGNLDIHNRWQEPTGPPF